MLAGVRGAVVWVSCRLWTCGDRTVFGRLTFDPGAHAGSGSGGEGSIAFWTASPALGAEHNKTGHKLSYFLFRKR
eukprot:3150057-Prymnesium_polylepis.2